ncbi:MAG: hypothetical protein A3E82_06040 [Gammaproteobacteria bacterium RIFCSPHIGHO2_12_FULL_38_11]|nr:MAG: hypothetical protein A3E82_06040 [Gammaproteobacteria bacterium RIFCSPHIGHO2_12_FULL_38_11]
MRTLSTLIFATSCFATSACYALVSCPSGSNNSDPTSAVSCVMIQGGSQNHFVEQKIRGFSQTAIECMSPGEDVYMDNTDVAEGIQMGALHLGKNTFQYFQCADQTCTKKVHLNTYRFKLSKVTGSTTYNAKPAYDTVSLLDNYGVTCTPDAASRKVAFFI